MLLPAIALFAALSASGGNPDHPRLFLNSDEIDFLRQNLGHSLYQEAWSLTRGNANGARGPRVDRNYTFKDGRNLYSNRILNHDANDIYNLGLAYQLAQDSAYADKAAHILRTDIGFVDPAYESLPYWDAIVWDLMGIKMVLGADFIWDTLDSADQATFRSWFGTLARSVMKLHEKGGFYSYTYKNKAGNNIKSWDNALIGLTGYLIEDRELIEYAIQGVDNGTTDHGWIELHYRSQIRNGTVEEWSGVNSQYGPFRTVDWHRAIDEGQSYVETIGYQVFHQQANELLCRAALRHGLDLYRIGTRSFETDQRHHPVQPVERVQKFVDCLVDAEHNEWRTWNGSDWVYSSSNRNDAYRSSVKLAGFSDEVSSPNLQELRDRMDAMIAGGLTNGSKTDWHIVQWSWPLTRIHQVLGLPETGDVGGQLVFEGGAVPGAEVSMTWDFHQWVDDMTTPVEVDDDGSYDALSLVEGEYWMIARAPGFKSALGHADVQSGQLTTAADIQMHLGEHQASPPGGDYLDRADVPVVRFSHRDPASLAGITQFRVYLRVAGGSYLDLTATAPHLLSVEQQDDQNMVLALDLDSLNLPDNEADLWFTAVDQAAGVMHVDRARYRFR